jgi:hypothetical protein
MQQYSQYIKSEWGNVGEIIIIKNKIKFPTEIEIETEIEIQKYNIWSRNECLPSLDAACCWSTS